MMRLRRNILKEDNYAEQNKNIINSLIRNKSKTIKDILYNMQNDMQEDIIEIMYNVLNPLEIVINSIPNSEWILYDDSVVLNVKNKGFPDWEKVLQEVVKDNRFPKDKTVEDLENYCTQSFLDELFWDYLNLEIDDLSVDFDYVVVKGRSGGYWGLDVLSYEVLTINSDAVSNIIEDILDNFWEYVGDRKIVDEDNDSLDNEYFENYEIDVDTIYDIIEDTALKNIAKKNNIEDFVELSNEADIKFESFYQRVESIISEFESTDKWVETIINNQYWD